MARKLGMVETVKETRGGGLVKDPREMTLWFRTGKNV